MAIQSKLRNYFQVNIYGEPIPGTNVRILKRPTHFGKGQRWVQFLPASQAFPCCETGHLTITSIGKKWRYYVRLREGTNEPIPGSLIKHQQKPTSWPWQEVVGTHQCATSPQWNVTYTTTDPSIATNLYHLLGLDSNLYTFVAFSGDGDDGHVTLTLNTSGDLAASPDGAPVTDTVTLQYKNEDGCLFAFRLTFAFE